MRVWFPLRYAIRRLPRPECTGDLFAATWLVKAVKGEEPDWSGQVRIGTAVERLTSDRWGDACDLVGRLFADRRDPDRGPLSVTFVPVPNSKTSVGSPYAPSTYSIARALQEHLPGHNWVQDFLRFDREYPSAHKEGGARDAPTIFSRLRLRPGATVNPQSTFVLVDDVMRHGGHLQACAAFIRALGGDARYAAVVGVATPDVSHYSIPERLECRYLEDWTPL